MTCDQIKKLHAECKRISVTSRGLGLMGRIREWACQQAEDWDVLSCPDFGGTMVMCMASLDQAGSLLEKPHYLWVRKAMEFLAVRGKVPSHDLEALAFSEAWALRGTPGRRQTLMHAALLANDSTLENVAEALGIAVPVVSCYTTLFFDVLDRKDEPAYRQIAMMDALTPRGHYYAVRHVTPADAALLVAGLCGTLADVMEMAKSGGWESAA